MALYAANRGELNPFLLVRDGFRELVGAEDYGKLDIKLVSGGDRC
jgi:hypothetical protein